MPRHRLAIALATTCALASVLAACGVDASSGRAPGDEGPTVLVLRTSYATPADLFEQIPAARTFVDRVAAMTGGRVRVDVAGIADASDAEPRAFRDVAAGDVDLAIVATRGIEGAGVEALAPLQAPLVVQGVEAERRVLASQAPQTLLAALHAEAGVDGLALLAGPLRRPFGASDAPLGPDGYAGRSAWFFPGSPTLRQTAEALGATPVATSLEDWKRGVADGSIATSEADLRTFLGNPFGSSAQLTANVVLYARFAAIVARPGALDALAADDRDAVRAAAGEAAAASLATLPDEGKLLSGSCTRLRPLATADAAEVAALRGAVEPLLADLRAGAASGPSMRLVEAAAAGTATDALVPPATCAGAEAAATTLDATPAIADGTYRVSVSLADVEAVFPGIARDDALCSSGTFTLRLKAGAFVEDQVPLTERTDLECLQNVRFAGTYGTSGDLLVLDGADHFTEDLHEVYRWSLDGDVLHLELVSTSGPGLDDVGGWLVTLLGGERWTRVAG